MKHNCRNPDRRMLNTRQAVKKAETQTNQNQPRTEKCQKCQQKLG